MKPRSFVCALLALLLCTVLAWGQAVSGSMVGTVTDSSGASVPNAKITIIAVETNHQGNRDGRRCGPHRPAG